MTVDANALIAYAKTALGTWYKWGGNSMKGGIDCSGLIQQVYSHFGISLPRTTYTQIKVGAQVSYRHLQPGDMMFFDTEKNVPGADHVGMYIGNGKMIEAPHTGAKVRITDVTKSYYRDSFMGGRRVAGLKNGGQYDPSMASDATPLPGPGAATRNTKSTMNVQDLSAHYGWSYSFLKNVPELKGLFAKSVEGNWSTTKFQAEVAKTSWWRNASDTVRQFQVMKNTDPASYEANMQSSIQNVKDKAHALGAYPSAGIIRNIAQDGMTMGLDDNQLTQMLAGYVDFHDKHLGGMAGQVEEQAHNIAYSNGINLTDQAVKNNAVQIIKGQKSMAQFEKDIRTQATGMYPAYKEQIDSGENLSDIAQPYMDMMAQTMEKDPGSITLFDPTIKKALNGLNQEGKPTGMDLGQFEQLLKSQPGWKQTQNAQDAAMTGVGAVLKQMGLGS